MKELMNPVEAMMQREIERLTAERDALLEFVTRVSKQKPEKPDYWSSCGQCERNESDAEDVLAAIAGEKK